MLNNFIQIICIPRLVYDFPLPTIWVLFSSRLESIDEFGLIKNRHGWCAFSFCNPSRGKGLRFLLQGGSISEVLLRNDRR